MSRFLTLRSVFISFWGLQPLQPLQPLSFIVESPNPDTCSLYLRPVPFPYLRTWPLFHVLEVPSTFVSSELFFELWITLTWVFALDGLWSLPWVCTFFTSWGPKACAPWVHFSLSWFFKIGINIGIDIKCPLRTVFIVMYRFSYIAFSYSFPSSYLYCILFHVLHWISYLFQLFISNIINFSEHI